MTGPLADPIAGFILARLVSGTEEPLELGAAALGAIRVELSSRLDAEELIGALASVGSVAAFLSRRGAVKAAESLVEIMLAFEGALDRASADLGMRLTDKKMQRARAAFGDDPLPPRKVAPNPGRRWWDVKRSAEEK